MKTLHACLMGTFAVALLAVGAGFLVPGGHAAIAQHGHAEQAEAQAHFYAMMHERLCGASMEASHHDGAH